MADALAVPITDLLGTDRRPRHEPVVLRRIAAQFDGQPSHVQTAVETIVKAVVRALRASKGGRESQRFSNG